MIWLTGGALTACLAMIVGLLLLVVAQGMPTFWPQPVVQVKTLKGRTHAGEISRAERYEPSNRNLQEEVPLKSREEVQQLIERGGGTAESSASMLPRPWTRRSSR